MTLEGNNARERSLNRRRRSSKCLNNSFRHLNEHCSKHRGNIKFPGKQQSASRSILTAAVQWQFWQSTHSTAWVHILPLSFTASCSGLRIVDSLYKSRDTNWLCCRSKRSPSGQLIQACNMLRPYISVSRMPGGICPLIVMASIFCRSRCITARKMSLNPNAKLYLLAMLHLRRHAKQGVTFGDVGVIAPDLQWLELRHPLRVLSFAMGNIFDTESCIKSCDELIQQRKLCYVIRLTERIKNCSGFCKSRQVEMGGGVITVDENWRQWLEPQCRTCKTKVS